MRAARWGVGASDTGGGVERCERVVTRQSPGHGAQHQEYSQRYGNKCGAREHQVYWGDHFVIYIAV